MLSQVFTMKMLEDRQKGSWAALDTISKLVVDIAHSHSKNLTSHNIETLPPTCSYIVRAALKHLSTNRHVDGDVRFEDCEALKKMLGHFNHRWNTVER